MKLIFAATLAFVFAALNNGVNAAIHGPGESPYLGVPANSRRADPGADPWWAGFNDPILGSLQRVARARVIALMPLSAPTKSVSAALQTSDAGIAVTYIGIRTMEGRAFLLDDMQTAMDRNRQLISAGGPNRMAGQELAALDAHLATVGPLKAGSQTTRASLLKTLVASTGMPITLVEAVLSGGAYASGLSFPTFATSVERVTAVAPSPAVHSLHSRAAALSQQVATRQRQANTTFQRWKGGLASELDALWADEAFQADAYQLSDILLQLNLAWIDAYLRSRAGAGLPGRSDADVSQQDSGTL